MKVYIKSFDVQMEVKTKGIGLDVYDTNDKLMGKLYITKTKLIWCRGKTKRENGKSIRWNNFIEFMNKG